MSPILSFFIRTEKRKNGVPSRKKKGTATAWGLNFVSQNSPRFQLSFY